MCKIFRPNLSYDPFALFGYMSIAISGPIIHFSIKPDHSAVFALFTIVFGIGAYADGWLFDLKICDDRIAISRWGVDVWNSSLDSFYSTIEHPLWINFYESSSGKELRTIHLTRYTMLQIEEIITALRVAGVLRES